MTKFSVYGDSVALGLAARIQARQPTKLASYNDYARGGNSFVQNLAGDCGGPLFGGLTFAQNVQTVDDASIVVLHLGGNEMISAMDGSPLTPANVPYDYLGGDGLMVASVMLQHLQYIEATGKKAVVCGIPHFDPAKAMLAPLALTGDQCKGLVCRFMTVNQSLRILAALRSEAFVATYGAPIGAGQPVPDSTSTTDGIHPSSAYATAVANFLADQIVALFGL